MDIIVSNHRSGYYGEKQFELAGIDWTTYDITVVKLGYIWPELQEKAAFLHYEPDRRGNLAENLGDSLQKNPPPHVSN